MTLREEYKIKRLALNMNETEVAAIVGLDVGIYTIWENGGYVERWQHYKIKDAVEAYIRNLPREKYLHTRIREETMLLEHQTQDDRVKTLAHMMIHVSKLQMMYVGDKEF